MPDFLKKIQEKPLSQKKTIFWILAVLTGIICLLFWFYMIRVRLANIDKNRLNRDLHLSEIKEQLGGLKDLQQLKNLDEKEE